MRRGECGLQFCSRRFEAGERAQLFIEAEFPRGPRVRGGDDLAVSESQFETFAGRAFSERACSADGLVVEDYDPVVGSVPLRGCRFLAADCFEIVGDDLLGGRELLRRGALLAQRGQDAQQNKKNAVREKLDGGCRH